MATSKPKALHFTADEKANQYLATDPLALLIGMVLDQQIPLEKAFVAPYLLRERLGRDLDAAEIAATAPDDLVEKFSAKPALHRFPAAMARRVQEVCAIVATTYDNDAASIWTKVPTGVELAGRLRALPGFGPQKAQIFLALLAKRLGVKPTGWAASAGPFGKPGSFSSVADIDGPAALVAVREQKRALKLAAKSVTAKSR